MEDREFQLKLDRLADALADDLLKITDAEIKAELVEIYGSEEAAEKHIDNLVGKIKVLASQATQNIAQARSTTPPVILSELLNKAKQALRELPSIFQGVGKAGYLLRNCSSTSKLGLQRQQQYTDINNLGGELIGDVSMALYFVELYSLPVHAVIHVRDASIKALFLGPTAKLQANKMLADLEINQPGEYRTETVDPQNIQVTQPLPT